MKNSLLSLLLLLLLLLELIIIIIIIIISYLCWFTYCCTMFSISSRFRLANSSNVTSADVVGMSASVTTSLTALLIRGFCFFLIQLCSRHSKYKSCFVHIFASHFVQKVMHHINRMGTIMPMCHFFLPRSSHCSRLGSSSDSIACDTCDTLATVDICCRDLPSPLSQFHNCCSVYLYRNNAGECG